MLSVGYALGVAVGEHLGGTMTCHSGYGCWDSLLRKLTSVCTDLLTDALKYSSLVKVKL